MPVSWTQVSDAVSAREITVLGMQSPELRSGGLLIMDPVATSDDPANERSIRGVKMCLSTASGKAVGAQSSGLRAAEASEENVECISGLYVVERVDDVTGGISALVIVEKGVVVVDVKLLAGSLVCSSDCETYSSGRDVARDTGVVIKDEPSSSQVAHSDDISSAIIEHTSVTVGAVSVVVTVSVAVITTVDTMGRIMRLAAAKIEHPMLNSVR